MVAAAVFFASAASAVAAGRPPGEPPPGMAPIAGSVYTAQFALCSLDTVPGLARSQHVALAKLTPAAAATRVAQMHEQDRGSAALSGCRAGLLYRAKNDEALASLRSELSDRIVAEKYVVGVYGLIVVAFFAWVVIHAARVSRLERAIEALSAAAQRADRAR